MRSLRISLKLLALFFLGLVYIALSLFWRLRTRDLSKRRYHYTHTVSFVCSQALKIMNFRVRAIGLPPRDASYFLVGNHLGIWDIFVLSSLHPTLFITSVDMRQTPGLGFLTEMGGCLYVERRKRSNITDEIEEIRSALRQGHSVTLYPEGTSSNGERMLPFKRSLLSSVVGTQLSILPVVINYRKVNGEAMSAKWRDHACWYGDQTFPPALLRALSLRSVEVEIEFCQEVHIQSENERKIIADQLYEIIASKFTPISA